ncbi:MAG TPA: glycosyltransferase family 2 protein [Actinomycetes bacterium]|nr:glycosyltransferase family 2 protein [Actinomycetes bacterium]
MNSSTDTPVPPDERAPGALGVPGDPSVPSVLTVVVCHNGGAFLERTLTALGELRQAPDRLIAVDVGSSDDTMAVLQAPGSPVDEIIRVPATTGFATAVHAGVDEAGASEWVWVLHDDSAPEPDALEQLLTAASGQPSVGILGPKVLGWDEPRRLLEVGISISRSGRRHTGLESHEQDQGQYEAQRDVLGVGSAGLLVRRDVWDGLGGFDRHLRLFREDVDFGWRANLAGHRVVVVPDAVIHHAEAAARGRRGLSSRRLHQDDRTSALYVLLTNSTSAALLPRWLWLLAVSLLRALGFLLGKSPQEAGGELGAISQALLRLHPIRVGRRSRKRRRSVSARSLRSLFPPPGQQVRATLETVVGALTVNADVQPSTILESGPGDEDIDSFGTTGGGRLARLLRRPGSVVFLGLLIIGVVTWRGLYRGGELHGGSLLPVPSGAMDLWSTYVASWHPVTAGSPVVAPPSLAVLAFLGSVLLGKATWAVPVVLVTAPAIAGLVSFAALRSLGLSARLRLWAALAYALNPALVAAISQGRWGTAVVAVLLPLLALLVARTCGLGRPEASGRAAAGAAVLLSVIVAVTASMWLPLAALGLLAAWRLATDHRARLLMVAVVLAPALLLLPWIPQLFTDPSLLLLESGVPLTSNSEPPWHALLLNAGGASSVPLFLGVGLLVAGVAAASRAATLRPVRVALVVAGVGLGWGLLLDSATVTPTFSALPVAPWAGTPLVLAVGGIVVAAAVAARSSRRRLETRALSWRQPAVAIVTLLAVSAPLLTGLWWVGRGAAGPIDRGVADPLPAFVRAQSDLPSQIRTLVVEPAAGRLAYTLLRTRDAQIGDVETAPPAGELADLDSVVADLASGRGSAPVDRLTQYGVQYILALPPVEPSLETALDSAPGLLRVANPGEASLWRVERPAGRLRVVEPNGSETVVPSSGVDTTTQVPAGAGDRSLELAELADPGWAASEAGRDLPEQEVSGWSQGFVVSAAASEVSVRHANPVRVVLLVIELVAVVVVVVLALPSRRRDEETAV